MTIDMIQNQQTRATEKPPLTVQNDVMKDVNKQIQQDAQKETSSVPNAQSKEKLMMASATAQQPHQQIQKVAQNQISRGYLDIRI